MNEADRHRLFAGFCPGDNRPLRARPPQVIDNNVNAIGKLLLKCFFQRVAVLRQGDGHIGTEVRE